MGRNDWHPTSKTEWVKALLRCGDCDAAAFCCNLESAKCVFRGKRFGGDWEGTVAANDTDQQRQNHEFTISRVEKKKMSALQGKCRSLSWSNQIRSSLF